MTTILALDLGKFKSVAGGPCRARLEPGLLAFGMHELVELELIGSFSASSAQTGFPSMTTHLPFGWNSGSALAGTAARNLRFARSYTLFAV
jgi:hypothetical protein